MGADGAPRGLVFFLTYRLAEAAPRDSGFADSSCAPPAPIRGGTD